MYEGNLLFQELKYCGYFFFSVILSYHILMELCTCDSSLHYLHLSHSVAVVSIFMHKIKLQLK